MSELSGSVYAWGQTEVSPLGELRLQTDFRDYSEVIGKVLTSSGVVDDSGMGVTVFDMLPDQAVGCVRSVAHPVFTPWTGRPEPRPVASMNWSGRITGELPMAELPGVPKNGFEFVANFSMPAESGYVSSTCFGPRCWIRLPGVCAFGRQKAPSGIASPLRCSMAEFSGHSACLAPDLGCTS